MMMTQAGAHSSPTVEQEATKTTSKTASIALTHVTWPITTVMTKGQSGSGFSIN